MPGMARAFEPALREKGGVFVRMLAVESQYVCPFSAFIVRRSTWSLAVTYAFRLQLEAQSKHVLGI
jgi:hypothetical protein